MNMLEINGLKKSFGAKEVIKDLTLSIPENRIFGFVGQNGAGKTTTMKMILGLLKQDAGSILVNGQEVTYGNSQTNKYVGYLPDVPEYYMFMTPEEYLTFCGEIAGVPKAELKPRVHELLKLVGLYGEKRRIKGFSRGMKQRLGIAQAIIHRPKLLICDEPTSALDPIGRKEVLDVLMEAKKETTIIFSTHILTDVERICDDVVFLHDGRIVLCGDIEDIKKRHTGSDFKVVLANPGDAARLTAFSPRIKAEDAYVLHVSCIDGFDIRNVMKFMLDNDIPFNTIARCDESLEKLFVEVVEG